MPESEQKTIEPTFDTALAAAQLDRLFETHRRTDLSLGRWLSVSSFLGIMVFTLICYPYSELFDRKRDQERELERVEREIQSLQEEQKNVEASLKASPRIKSWTSTLNDDLTSPATYTNIRAGINEQSKEIETWIKVVSACENVREGKPRGWPPEMGEKPPYFGRGYYHGCPEAQKEATIDDCWWRQGQEWQYCQLLASFERQVKQIHSTYLRLPVKPKENIHTDLHDLLNDTTLFLKGELRQDGQLRPEDLSEVRGYLRQLGSAYEDFASATIKALEGYQSDIEEALEVRANGRDAVSTDLEETKGDLERLNQFENLPTAIGDIPVTLNQIIFAMPVALICAFIFCLSLASRATNLRAEILRLYARQDPDRQVAGPSQISLVAPVWAEHASVLPGAPGWPDPMKILALAAPLVMAVFAILTYVRFNVLVDVTSDMPGGLIPMTALYAVLIFCAALASYRFVLALVWRLKRP